MTTITKERLLTIKQWRETYGPGSNVVLPAEEAEELARIALTSLEAEPVGEVSEKQHGLVMDGTVDLGGKSTYRIIKGEKAMKLLPLGTKFYTAPPAPITPEAIENAIEYIRSIAFHIDEDDYHGKHIAYFMRQALAWLEGHSCSNDRLGKADNQPVRGNQTAESNRGNEWTGNPDIDNAIIMLDRIDTLENCDDDRIEAVKAVLRRLAGNYPDIPDSSVPAPGKGVTGERIRIKPHVYRELVNRLHDTAIKCAGTQQLRERISRVLGDVITPDHHKQAEKSGLERCRLEAALNIKPGHTLGIIDALLVHKMARALLPLVAEKHEVDHANES
ncbi:TPA: hypothetical protein KKM84_004331 [Escherichia coli]|nr:hypothetical protein [Escherichia coli]HDP7706136.1 hypothetical protein [Escherichia coli]